jgi:tetratricopeptide (TPR) repeat protein
MRHLWLAISMILLWSGAMLAQQSQQIGMSTDQTRRLNEITDMGHSRGASTHESFEEADDPTWDTHPVPQHKPLRAARKAAEKAEHLAKKKRHDEAIAGLREAVAIDPLYFEAWNNLALELRAAGQTEEAERVLRRLMHSNPEHVLVFTNLASLLYGQHRYAEAEAVARQAMKLHSFSFKANLVLGTILVQEGKWTDDARDKLQYAEVKYPEAKKLLERWPSKAVK